MGTSGSYVIKNNNTGYTFDGPISDDIGDLNYRGGGYILDATAVDVDGDGVYELIVIQCPSKWTGLLYSLIRYNADTKRFETEYAAYIENDWSGVDVYSEFLKQAGYDINDVTFIKQQ